MATKVEENPTTPDSVAKLATQAATLSRVALIGVFGSEANLAALVRDETGGFTRVTVGDTFNGGKVVAIDEDSLMLSRSGNTKVMKLPRV